MKLAELISQTHFESPAQEALLNVIATGAYIQAETGAAVAREGITTAQYNALRILRGAHPEPATCSYIGERLLDRTPDVTRLIARLQKAGLVTRSRADYDRRVVEVRLTDEGLAVLAALDEPVRAGTARLAGHLTEDEQRTLSLLLEKVRTDQV